MIRRRRTWPGLPAPLRPSPHACTTCGGSQVIAASTAYVPVAPGIDKPIRTLTRTVCLTCEPPG